MVNRLRVLEKIDFQNFRKSVKKPENSRCSDLKSGGFRLSSKHKCLHVGSQGCVEQFALSGCAQGQVQVWVRLGGHVQVWITGMKIKGENGRYMRTKTVV